MTLPTLPATYEHDTTILRLVRDIAVDMSDIETILKNHRITPDQWDLIQKNPRFLTLLGTETTAWNAAGNTHERVKLKAAALLEEWLVEANGRLHDKEESLSAKTELAKLLAKMSDIGLGDVKTMGGSEGFRVTINLGADTKLQFDKQTKVIDATPNPPEA